MVIYIKKGRREEKLIFNEMHHNFTTKVSREKILRV